MSSSSPFVRHVATMVGGTAIAQLIPFAASPVLTRLYSPVEFGVFSAVAASAAVLSIFATMRYELAIVLPSDDAVAADLAIVAVGWSIVFCAVIAFVLALFPNFAAVIFGKAAELRFSIPVLTLLIAWTQVVSFACNRERAYPALAFGGVIQQTGAAALGIGLGLAAFPWNGLVLGRMTGQLLAVGSMGAAMARRLTKRPIPVRLAQLGESASWYRQFPLFNVPYSVIGTFSREFAILALTAFHALDAAGYYGLARSVLMAPVGFLSSSLSQVFYREAAASIGTPGFVRLTLNLLQYIAAALVPFFVLGWLWAPDVFDMLFGARWRPAGAYASALMPIALLSLFTSWPERVFEVRQKQYVSLAIQATFDAIATASVWIALWWEAEPLTAVRLYVSVQIGYHLVYLFAVFRLSGMGTADYLRLTGLTVSIVVGSAALQAPIFWLPTAPWIQFVCSCVATGALASILLFCTRRNLISLAGTRT